jgi:hypothetical protein
MIAIDPIDPIDDNAAALASVLAMLRLPLPIAQYANSVAIPEKLCRLLEGKKQSRGRQ